MHLIFDANFSHRLSAGLDILNKGNSDKFIKIDHADTLLGAGATDEEIIHEAGKTKAIIISQDDDFKRIRSNKLLIKALGVGYVLYRPPKHGCRYWEIVNAFILCWPKLKETLSTAKTPFIFELNKSGQLHEVAL